MTPSLFLAGPYAGALASVTLMMAAALVGVRAPHLARRILRILGWWAVVFWFVLSVVLPFGLLIFGRIREYRIEELLPVHVCHFVLLFSGLGPLTGSRLLRAHLHFAGFCLCTQALVTPLLSTGYDDPYFWVFWIGHGLILVNATLDAVAGAYRPRWSEYGFVCLTMTCGLAASAFVNQRFGWNLWFTGEDLPLRATLLDYLGSWPERVFVMGGLAIVVMAVVCAFERHLRHEPIDALSLTAD